MRIRFLNFWLVVLLVGVYSFTFADRSAGLYKLTIKEGWNLISLPMQTLQRAVGKTTSVSGSAITDSTKNWAENAYQNDVLMISSGTGEGYYYRINSNTTDMITTDSIIDSSVVVDDYFYVYKSYTLEELFGDADGPLYGSDSKTSADEIFLWDNDTQAFSTSIWLCNVSGQEGWWQGNTKLTDNSITLVPNEACFIVRKLATDVVINFVGIIPDTKQTINVMAGETVAGGSFPVAVTVANSGLDSVLQSGTSSYTADNIYQWNYSDQKFDLPIWHSNYPGYESWYQGADEVNTLSITPGEGFMIRNRQSETDWPREKPYSTP